MNRKWPLVLLISCIGVGSCASGRVYTKYNIDPVHDTLLAHDPKNDLPLRATCQATPGNNSHCTAMLTPEAFAMETELLELRQALKDCQSGPHP